jgi:hypothetical protein
VLKGKSLDDIVNDISKDIDDDLIKFARYAQSVQKWDQKIIENGDKVRIFRI